ncbi:MAG: hypothetical protein IJ262_00260 [Clostridia bacterium]|nr:hypothetical protein [Clostridia bacterium]
MNLDSINGEAVSQLLSSLSEEDIAGLMNMAQSVFSSQTPPKKEEKKKEEGSFDFSSIAKIASLMGFLSGEENDPRCNLLSALKPLLSKEKQSKVDQAIKMLHLMAVLPKLKELN